MKWADDEIETVAVLLKEGLSASQIGAKVGKTRNAIIGVVGRNAKLKAIGFSRAPFRPKPSTNGVRVPKSEPKVVRPNVRSKPLRLREDMALHTVGRPLMDVHGKRCRFPVAESDQHLFCGAHSQRGIWCEHHRRIVYRPAKSLENLNVA